MKQKHRPDPIVAEIHRTRERFWVESRQNPAQLWKNILKRAELALRTGATTSSTRGKKAG